MVGKIEELARERLLSRRREIQKLFFALARHAHEADEAPPSTVIDEPQLKYTTLHDLSSREAYELNEVDAALGRIESGKYGRCQWCGGPVGLQRLTALPETRFCLTCASRSHEPHRGGELAAPRDE